MSLLSDARDLQARAEAWAQQSIPNRVLEFDTLHKAARVLPAIVEALERLERLEQEQRRIDALEGEG